jgi:calcium-dependent protein kinase
MAQNGKKYSENKAAELIAKMLAAVAYLHTKTIAHRDLKLANFVFEDKSEHAELKLIDFGLSKVYWTGDKQDIHVKMESFVGTSHFIAPEVLRGEYNNKCDVWSIGVITYMLLSGKPPFKGMDDKTIYNQIEKGRLDFSTPLWKSRSALSKDFISKLMTTKVNERFNALQALQHPWLSVSKHTENIPLDDEVVDALLKFEQFSAFKRAALQLMAYQLDRESLKKMRRSFRSIDKDNSGRISLSEMKEALKAYNISPERVDAIFKKVDVDMSGHIRYTEFIAASMEKKMYHDKELMLHAFEKMDTENTGKITVVKLLEILGGEYTMEEVRHMMKESNIADTGELTYADFINLLGEDPVGETQQSPKKLATVTEESGDCSSASSLRSRINSDEVVDTLDVGSVGSSVHVKVGGGDSKPNSFALSREKAYSEKEIPDHIINIVKKISFGGGKPPSLDGECTPSVSRSQTPAPVEPAALEKEAPPITIPAPIKVAALTVVTGNVVAGEDTLIPKVDHGSSIDDRDRDKDNCSTSEGHKNNNNSSIKSDSIDVQINVSTSGVPVLEGEGGSPETVSPLLNSVR